MRKIFSAIGLGLAFLASPCGAQTSQTITLPSLALPPVKTVIAGTSVSIPQPSVPLPSFTVTFPKQGNATNIWNVTNTWNFTNWTFLTVTQTNVQNVWITNTFPNYIPSLTVTGQLTVLGGIFVKTNL